MLSVCLFVCLSVCLSHVTLRYGGHVSWASLKVVTLPVDSLFLKVRVSESCMTNSKMVDRFMLQPITPYTL